MLEDRCTREGWKRAAVGSSPGDYLEECWSPAPEIRPVSAPGGLCHNLHPANTINTSQTARSCFAKRETYDLYDTSISLVVREIIHLIIVGLI